MIEHLGSLPVLLLVTFRPEFTPPWPTASSTLLHLSRLDHGQSIALVERLTGDKPLPSQLLDQIVSRADGVPLFLEELTRTVLESGLLQDRGNRLELHGPLPPLAVPATLQDSLMARLDRLGASKEVGQIGAVIGREFSRELLAELARRSEHELQNVLDQLVEAGLIQPQPAPLPAYSFKHALIQDAAYGSMLRDKRRMLHARLAAILERRFPDLIDSQPEMLAQHCAAARMPEKAVQYWHRAGERAAKRSANLEAVRHFQAGLALINELPDKAMRAEQELRLLIALGPLLIITQGWQAPDVERIYARARKLAEEGGRLAELFPVLWGLWVSCHASVSPLQAVALVEELFELSGRLQDPEYLLQAHHAGCSTRHSLGQSMLALRHMDELLAMYKRDLHGHSSAVYGGHDPAVCALGDRAEIEWMLGYPDRALATTDEGLALARALRHTGSVVHALWNVADLRLLRGEPDFVLMFSVELQSLASEHGLRRSYEGVALTFQGWACAVRGARKDAISKLRIGTRLCQDYGSINHDAGFLVRLAHTYQLAGEAEEALKLVDDILNRLDGLWERWVEPEVYRLKGEILRTLPNPDVRAAEESFETAIELAPRKNC